MQIAITLDSVVAVVLLSLFICMAGQVITQILLTRWHSSSYSCVLKETLASTARRTERALGDMSSERTMFR